MKISNKHKLQQVLFNRSSDIQFGDFMELYKQCINNAPQSFLLKDNTDNPLRFTK